MYGIGEFGFQSYMIFCRAAAQTLWPADRALQSFVRWARGAGDEGGLVGIGAAQRVDPAAPRHALLHRDEEELAALRAQVEERKRKEEVLRAKVLCADIEEPAR